MTQLLESIRGALQGRNVELIAQHMGIEACTLYQYAEGRRFIPAHLIPALCAATGNTLAIDALVQDTKSAMSGGQQVLPLPIAPMELAKEAHDIPQSVLAALSNDGRIDKREARDVWRQVSEFGKCLLQFLTNQGARRVETTGRFGTLKETQS